MLGLFSKPIMSPSHTSPESILTTWWVQPFNGQLIRYQTCVEVCSTFKPQYAIETGTFYGTTTVALSSLVSKQTFTIEINPNYVQVAKSYFKRIGINDDRIRLLEGSSATEIVEVLSNISKDSRILVYLDAHWGDKLPLQDELNALINWGGAFIAVIDDFYVDHDSNFGFDSYEGTKLDLNLIPDKFEGEIFLPSHSADKEFGARRGTCYLFSSKALISISSVNFANLMKVRNSS